MPALLLRRCCILHVIGRIIGQISRLLLRVLICADDCGGKLGQERELRFERLFLRKLIELRDCLPHLDTPVSQAAASRIRARWVCSDPSSARER
jgi:hypothetical protein